MSDAPQAKTTAQEAYEAALRTAREVYIAARNAAWKAYDDVEKPAKERRQAAPTAAWRAYEQARDALEKPQ